MTLPLVIDAAQLAQALNTADLLIVDLSSQESYAAGHIPGAIRIDPAMLMSGRQPIPNKLPDAEQLSQSLSAMGLTEQHHVVAYDDQNGALAGRLIWTLHSVGHQRCSFLNGLLPAWIADGQPLEQQINQPQPSDYQAQLSHDLVVDIPWLLDNLNSETLCIWDARSEAEYHGDKIINAQKGGHIPGALCFEWTDSLIGGGDLRLKPADQLRQELAEHGISGQGTLVTHCQTHRRSGLTYLVARHLGFDDVRCYDGSWFEWGNHPDTPVER